MCMSCGIVLLACSVLIQDRAIEMMEDGALDAVLAGGNAAAASMHKRIHRHHKKHHKKHHRSGEHSESEPESDGISDDDDVEEDDTIAFDVDGSASNQGDLRASSSSRPSGRRSIAASSARASEDAQAAAAGMKKVKNTPQAYSKVREITFTVNAHVQCGFCILIYLF